MENKLRYCRLVSGMSQTALGKALDLPQTYISRIENGTIDIKNISIKNAYEIALILGCRIEDLVGEKYLTALEDPLA